MINKHFKYENLELVDWLMYIGIFSIIYQSGSVPAAFSMNTITFQITRVLIIAIPILFLLKYLKYLSKRSLLIIMFLQILGLINLVLYPTGFIKFEYKFILFVLFFLCIKTGIIRKYNFYSKFYNLLFIIISISLLFYFLVGILRVDVPYTTIPDHLEFKNYFNLYYAYSIKFIPRLSGYFWEPGAYEVYLNLELFLYILLKKDNKIQLAIILMSIVFCQSAMGYLNCIILLSYKIVNSSWYNRKFNVKSKMAVMMFIVAAILLAYVFLTKKAETNVEGDSYFVRMTDLRASIDIFIHNPIFGIGFGNVDEFLKYQGVTVSGSSNGFLTWAYYTGFVGLTCVLFPFIYDFLLEIKYKHKFNYFIFTIIFILMNFSEPFYNLPLMAFIVAQAYGSMVSQRAVDI